jgi:hypothetical protein
MAAAGPVILFVLAGVLLIIVGSWTLTLAAHYYLVVVQGTTAGIDRVEWSDDPIYDWIPQVVWFGGILFIWLALAAVVNRILGPSNQAGLRWALLAAGAVWLIFPVSVLSSLASESRWFILSPRVLARLLRIFPSLVVFYLITGVLLGLVGPLLYVGLLTPGWFALLFAAVLGSALLLIHARLVGRMAWLLGQVDHKSAGAGKRKPAAPKKRPRRPRRAEVSDPWAEPEPIAHQEESAGYALPGYQVVEQPLEKKAERSPLDLEDPDPYTLTEAPAAPAGEAPAPRLALDENKVQREIELRTHKPPNPPPAYPLFSGVYTFPLYSTSHKAWVGLSLWGLATLVIMRVVLLFSGVVMAG